jgi:N4-gp56 family major capsid protein
MANELDAGQGGGNSEGQLFENVTQSAQFTFNENALLRNLVTVYNMVGTPGLTASVPVWPRVTGLTAITAGADLSNTDVAATAVDITAAEYGSMATIQDIVVESSPLAVAQDVGRVLGDAVAQAMDEVVVDLFTSASTDVGPGAGAEMTIDHILKAAATLRNNSVPMTGLVAVVHPLAAYNLKKTILNSGGQFSANDLANAAARSYYLGTVAGIDIYESASIDTDSGNDAISAVFHPAAIGMTLKRDLRIALQRDESIRGFEVVASAAFGAGILDQNKIVKITSDAAL